MNLEIRVEDASSKTASLLIKELSTELGALYHTDGSASFKPADVQIPRAVFVVAWLDSEPVACGALRPTEDEKTAEIKRMFVKKTARGLGISRKILLKLEELGKSFNYERLILETGDLQTEAIGLYESSAYTRMECYGEYVNSSYSICYEKLLD
jgi:putative acetyltransferase